MLRAGVCINCAEKIAALILESGPRELAAEPCSGACREAIGPLLLHFARALARAVSALGIGRGHGRAGRQPWLWTLAFGYHEDPRPTHSYEPTREATMAAFAKS